MTQVLCDENTFYFIIKNFLLSGPIILKAFHLRYLGNSHRASYTLPQQQQQLSYKQLQGLFF